MGTTDIYKLRYPELGDLADGPDALRKLATDVETNMTRNRNWFRSRGQGMSGNDSGTVVEPNATRQIMPAQTVTPVTVGWVDITVGFMLYPENPSSTLNALTWAGMLQLYMNGALAGDARFHNHGSALSLYVEVTSVIDVPVALTSMVFGVNMYVDQPANSKVRAIEWEFNAKQYGAPRVKTL